MAREEQSHSPSLPKIKVKLHKGLSSAHGHKISSSSTNLRKEKLDLVISSQQREDGHILHARSPSEKR